jgi:hypothetical protein
MIKKRLKIKIYQMNRHNKNNNFKIFKNFKIKFKHNKFFKIIRLY